MKASAGSMQVVDAGAPPNVPAEHSLQLIEDRCTSALVAALKQQEPGARRACVDTALKNEGLNDESALLGVVKCWRESLQQRDKELASAEGVIAVRGSRCGSS